MAFGSSITDVGLIPIAQTYVEGVGFVAMRGSLATNTDGSSNTCTAAVMQRATGTVLNQTSAALVASGNSSDLVVGPYTEVAVDINISAVSGTTPTAQFYIDRKGIDGNYYPLWTNTTAATIISQISTSIGSGCAVNHSLGSTIRLRWVLTGSSPSFTCTASILGK